MSFSEALKHWDATSISTAIERVTADDVRRALRSRRPSEADLMAFLSPAALPFLEEMVAKAQGLALRHFGRTVQLFTPLYLANHCTNQCRYCGFNARNDIERVQLTAAQIEQEGKAIASSGLRQLLLLTGDAPRVSTVRYIADAARILRPYFPSIGVEVYSMDTDEYAELVAAGVESFTMFQETYNPELYAYLHPAGPKRNFAYRLDAPERACQGGMRSIGLGALLGLDEWRRDAFFTVMHGSWLLHHYPATDISFSVPRMRPHTGEFQPKTVVSDRELVQIIAAYRLYLPMAGITVSSRESAFLRDNLIGLGVTRMSAGVSTAVGGHAAAKQSDLDANAATMAGNEDACTSVQVSEIIEDSSAVAEAGPSQFEISDDRSVDEMVAVIQSRGYQPIFKDWEPVEA
ncbi:MAG: 2-iminoacetate synthase ThiH [Pseudomonadota bacterium]